VKQNALTSFYIGKAVQRLISSEIVQAQTNNLSQVKPLGYRDKIILWQTYVFRISSHFCKSHDPSPRLEFRGALPKGVYHSRNIVPRRERI
jgi:hypothetical protein